MRPTNAGDTSLGKTTNRTYKASVCSSCEEKDYHKKLYTPPFDGFLPPWVFTKANCIEADNRMHSIIGPPGSTRIRNVMKAGKGDNTHDTLEWAFTYARWCWQGLGTRVYVDNILEIFDVLNILTASTMNIETVRMLIILLITYIFIYTSINFSSTVASIERLLHKLNG